MYKTPLIIPNSIFILTLPVGPSDESNPDRFKRHLTKSSVITCSSVCFSRLYKNIRPSLPIIVRIIYTNVICCFVVLLRQTSHNDNNYLIKAPLLNLLLYLKMRKAFSMGLRMTSFLDGSFNLAKMDSHKLTFSPNVNQNISLAFSFWK